MSFQGLLDVVDQIHVAWIVEVLYTQKLFPFFNTRLLKHHSPGFLVDLVILFADQPGDEFIDLVVLVGRLLGRTTDDQRRTGLIDENRVHFVNNRVTVSRLNTVLLRIFHVVTKVIEAKLVVGAVGHIT